MNRKIFFDTTKLEKIKRNLIGLDIVMIIFLILSWKATGFGVIEGMTELFGRGFCPLAEEIHLLVFCLFFWPGLIVVCTLQIVTLQTWIRTIEDAQQYHENRTDKKQV